MNIEIMLRYNEHKYKKLTWQIDHVNALVHVVCLNGVAIPRDSYWHQVATDLLPLSIWKAHIKLTKAQYVCVDNTLMKT